MVFSAKGVYESDLGFSFLVWGVVFLGERVGAGTVYKVCAVKYYAVLVVLGVLFHEFYHGVALGGEVGEKGCGGVFA